MKKYVLIALLILALAAVYFSWASSYITFESLRSYHHLLKEFVDIHPVSSAIFFFLIYTAAKILSIPGAIFIALVGGYLFPQPFSTFYVVLGITCAAAFVFLVAKTVLVRSSLRKKAGPLVQKLETEIRGNALSYLLFLRFVPLFPFWIVNIAFAYLGIRFRTFFWATFVGYFPGSLVITLAGGGLEKILETEQPFSLNAVFNTQIKIALLLLGGIALTPILMKWIRNRFKI